MSIQVKIFRYLLAFCAVLITLLWLFQVVFLDSIYKNIKVVEVKRAMDSLIVNIDKKDLEQYADNIFENQDINIEIVSANGKTEYLAVDKDLKNLRPEKQYIYQKALENNGHYLEYPESKQSEKRSKENTFAQNSRFDFIPRRMQQIAYCRIIQTSSGTDKTIFLNAMISPVNATVDALQTELIFITGFMLLFSIFLAILIAKRISKPIISINKSAKTLASGNYNVKFNAVGYREIMELSDTLNIAAKELSTVENLRQELLANVTHDLRTPLTLITGYAEAMRDLPEENTAENAQVIVDEATRLNKLVSEVLDLSKLQAGVLVIHPKRYNLTESLREAGDRLSEFTKANGYQIDFEASEDVFVTADEAKISQVIYNLLTNAINFTGEDKKISMKQTIEKNAILIEVMDTGKGIETEELPYIWDRYYRTGKKYKRGVIGTGIGLSIVKSIIILHGGTYGVNFQIGVGSTFWIRLKRDEKH